MLLVIGGKATSLVQVCSQLELVTRVEANPYVMPYEDQLPLYVCRGLKAPMASLWPSVKHYE